MALLVLTKCLALWISIIVVPSTIHAATYYVAKTGNDANPCTSSSPCLTINRGVSKVQSPGDTLIVKAGTYVVTPNALSEGVSTRASGTASARIRYRSESKWGAKIVSSGAYTIWRNYGNYVDIERFEIIGDQATNLGIDNKGSFVRIKSNKVHQIPVSQGCSNSSGGAGIDNSNYSASDNDVLGNLVYDVGPLPADGLPAASYCSSAQGIYHANLRGRIQNNICYHNGTFGIQLWHSANKVIVSNNLLFNNGAKTDKSNFVGGGILAGAGDLPGGVTLDNTTVSNNMVIYNRGAGIREYGTTGPGNRYLKNLLFGNGRNAVDVKTGIASGTIIADPLLVSFKLAGGGNYHLTSASPARNAGTNQCAPTISNCVPSTDYDGISRPQESFYDIGAYEYVSTTQALTADFSSPASLDVNADSSPNALDVQLLENAISGNSEAAGDLIPVKKSQIASTSFVVPAVANDTGENGAFFRTRIKLFNPTDHAYSINVLVMDPAGGQILKSLEVAANKYYRWDDFLGQFLGFSGGGALLFQSASGISSNDRFTLRCELYTDSAGGRHTTSVPAIELKAAGPSESPTPSWSNVGVTINSGQRMNLGCVNLNAKAISVVAYLFSNAGSLLKSVTLTLPGFSWKQVALDANVNNGNIVWSAPNATYPYIVSIDNTSNDGTLEMAQDYTP
jgi:hypothetical protein